MPFHEYPAKPATQRQRVSQNVAATPTPTTDTPPSRPPVMINAEQVMNTREARYANEVVGRFWGFGIAIAFIGALLSVTTLDSETSTPFALGLLLLGIGQTIVFVAVIATGVKWGTAAARA